MTNWLMARVSARALAAVVVAVVLGIAGFAVGYQAGGGGAIHVPIYTADGFTTADQAAFQVGNITYGFETTVRWTDSAGSLHSNGWPDCLPRLAPVKGVRFAAAVLWVGDTGQSDVIWVDC